MFQHTTPPPIAQAAWDDYISRLSQLNVVDILYTAYASRNHEDTMRRLTKTHIYKPGDPEVLTQP